MSNEFPTMLEVVTIHSVLIEEFGGTPGIRDQGALASALMRPQLGYYDGLIEEAAALMESLANNHPFVDGNRRVAFFVTDAFLRLNGQYIDCDSLEAFEFFMRLFETESFRYAALLPWLEVKVQPLPGR
ncbi:MAG: type II toxin-antitoxin system death-on-curing family toxin [Caldilineaceae bacterium]|nr:type II toxin-antitoxin system death-on-curing family toxin [Caldilineaceae bacterium]MDE0077499.1 type II toxin-antitoxin system death-on-curing family toxin [Caldilineaceae bacterium]